MSSWCESIELECNKLADEIVSQGGIIALCNGSLDKNIFSQFIMQDSIYLNSFKGSIVLLATRLCAEHKSEMLQFAYASVEAEQLMQNKLDNIFNWRLNSSEPLQVTNNYCQFEREMCTQSFICYGFASLLPCFWLYFEVVRRMKDISSKYNSSDNPYQFWIDSNSDPLFQLDILKFRALCDYYAAQQSEQTQQKMREVFYRAAGLEKQFYSLLNGV